MSIASEITRIQGAKADLKSAIEAKGVTVGNGLIDTYAAKVAQISGGSSSNYNAFTVADSWDTQEIEPYKIGDICSVVNNTRRPMTVDDYNNISKIHIDSIITLPDEIVENLPENLDCYFKTWDEDPNCQLEFYYADNMISLNVDNSSGSAYYDYVPTSDKKTWIIGGYSDQDGYNYLQPKDIQFEKEISFVQGSEPENEWNDVIGYFVQLGQPEYYTTLIAEHRNEQITYDDGIQDGIRYLVFYDSLVSINPISDPITGKLVAKDGSGSIELSLSSSGFTAILKDDQDTVIETYAYSSNDGEVYNITSDNYGVVDFGADPDKWFIWDENEGVYNYDFAPFLNTIDQTVTWNEIPVDGGAEPVS